MSYAVAFYEIDRKYGGPEEGGWWYDTGALVRVFRQGIPTADEAEAVAARANDLLRVLQRRKRDVGSVLYGGGRHLALVYEGRVPEYWPAHRPYYE